MVLQTLHRLRLLVVEKGGWQGLQGGDLQGSKDGRPICRYFLSEHGCKKGATCLSEWGVEAGTMLGVRFRASHETCPHGKKEAPKVTSHED